MHKTQVFISPEGDHYRTRLTYTLEVAQIARVVARGLVLNEDLTEAIALGHDLGHTPFGHTGEDALNKLLDGGFHHNEQSVRVVEFLENEGKGLNLTYEVVDGILNHRTRCNPSTPEARVVQLCDKIAYINHDIDDALRAKILIATDIPIDVRQILGETSTERIDFLVHDLVSFSFDKSEVSLSPVVEKTLKSLRSYLFENVYVNQMHSKERDKIEKMLGLLFEHYIANPEKLPKEYKDNEPARAVTDYIAGMTDRFAMKCFREIFMPATWEVKL